VVVFLNIGDLCREVHYCAKSTLERLENFLAITRSGETVLDLATIPNEQLGAKRVQRRRGKRETLLLHIFWEEHQRPHFILPSFK
jgi:hypothetical protein